MRPRRCRLAVLSSHIRTTTDLEPQPTPCTCSAAGPGSSLRQTATLEAPLGPAGFGARLRGVDLADPALLSADDVAYLLETFHEWKVLCIAGQDLERFSLAHFERFANHVGAPLPHPSTSTRLRERPALQVQSNVVGYWRPASIRHQPAVACDG